MKNKKELDKLEVLKKKSALYHEVMNMKNEDGGPFVSETWAKKNILGMSEEEIKDEYIYNKNK
jgi:hypothetical protein